MDQAPTHPLVIEPESDTRGWAGVWAAFTVLAIGAILSLSAWSDYHRASAAFVSAIGALTAVAYMATAYLLSNRLVISRSPALVLLASAYLLCGLAIAVYTVTFPGVAPEWWKHGPETSRWFWLVWHGAAALGIIGFVALDDEWAHRKALDVPESAQSDLVTRVFLRDAGAFMRGPLLLAVTLVIGSIVWLWRDPAPFTAWFSGTVLPPFFVGLLLVLDLTAITLLAVALRRDSLVRTWLLLAAVASLLDAAAMSWSGGPSTIGWYFSQACGLIAASVLPLVLLGDLRARLCAGEVKVVDPALSDAETGFVNERGLTVALGRAAKLALREDSSVAIAVVEVDDARAEAPAVRRLFRASDVIGRTGQREFGVILTPGSETGLLWLRKRLEAGSHLRIGIAQCDPTGPRPVGDLLDETLRNARASVSSFPM
jgi:GGDEF domain-containing protein